jgi:hypothetical protein
MNLIIVSIKKIKLLFLLIWFPLMLEGLTKDWRKRSDVQIGFQTGSKNLKILTTKDDLHRWVCWNG